MNTDVERHVSQFSLRLVAMAFGWCVFGVGLGAVGTIWQYESKPVVTVEPDGVMKLSTHDNTILGPDISAAPPLAIERQFEQYKADQAARFTRIDQRLEELTIAARKLAGVKQTWDLKMAEVGR